MQVRDGMSDVVLTVGPGPHAARGGPADGRRHVGAAVVLDPDAPGPRHHHRARPARRPRRGPGPRRRARRRPPTSATSSTRRPTGRWRRRPSRWSAAASATSSSCDGEDVRGIAVHARHRPRWTDDGSICEVPPSPTARLTAPARRAGRDAADGSVVARGRGSSSMSRRVSATQRTMTASEKTAAMIEMTGEVVTPMRATVRPTVSRSGCSDGPGRWISSPAGGTSGSSGLMERGGLPGRRGAGRARRAVMRVVLEM